MGVYQGLDWCNVVGDGWYKTNVLTVGRFGQKCLLNALNVNVNVMCVYMMFGCIIMNKIYL